MYQSVCLQGLLFSLSLSAFKDKPLSEYLKILLPCLSSLNFVLWFQVIEENEELVSDLCAMIEDVSDSLENGTKKTAGRYHCVRALQIESDRIAAKLCSYRLVHTGTLCLYPIQFYFC